MKMYNPDKHHRRSIRLRGYDYAAEGLYFITLCVENRWPIFGRISDEKMIKSFIGEIAEQEWLNTSKVRDNVVLHEYVIMPDHIHGIIEITQNKGSNPDTGSFKSPSQTIGSIIRGYKIATIKRIKNYILDEEGKGEGSKGEGSKGGGSKGELQFAPTIAPTAPSIIGTILKLDFKI